MKQDLFCPALDVVHLCDPCHLVGGTKAPEVCPVCNHPQSYFEVREEND